VTDELDKFKMWGVEILFIKGYLEEFESRWIDPIYEDCQVFVVGTVEFETSESRKDMAVGGDGSRYPPSGYDRLGGNSNSSQNVSRLVSAERQVAITSGDMNPYWGLSEP
jgi:hypothetical protein